MATTVNQGAGARWGVRFWWLGLLSCVAFLVQAVSAAPSIQLGAIAAPAAALAARGGFANVTIPWTYDFGDAATAQAAKAAFGSVTLGWDLPACDADGIDAGGNFLETAPIPDIAPGASSFRGSSNFTMFAHAQAPGEVPITCTFTVKAETVGPAIPATDPSSGTVTFQVAYRGLIAAEYRGNTLVGSPGQSLNFTLHLTNRGNADSYVSFQGPRDLDAAWQLHVPSPILLTEPGKGGTENARDVVVSFQLPAHQGWNFADQDLSIDVQPRSTKDLAQPGDVNHVFVFARVAGCYPAGTTCNPAGAAADGRPRAKADVGATQAAPDAPLPLAALGLVAFATLRRRA